MIDRDVLIESIRESAQTAKRAKGDNGEMEQHSLSDQIAADRYLRSVAAATAGPARLRFAKIVPPGSA